MKRTITLLENRFWTKVVSNRNKISTDIKVKLQPRSSKNQIAGKEGNLYKIKVTSPPIDGKANKALVSLLSKKLGISKGNIEIATGETSRIKRIRINGLKSEDVFRVMENTK